MIEWELILNFFDFMIALRNHKKKGGAGMFAVVYLTMALFGGMIVLGLCGLALERQEKADKQPNLVERQSVQPAAAQKRAC